MRHVVRGSKHSRNSSANFRLVPWVDAYGRESGRVFVQVYMSVRILSWQIAAENFFRTGGVVFLTTKLVTMAWIWVGIADVVSDVDRVGQPSVVLLRCTELLRGTQLWQGAAVAGRVRVRS